MLANQLRPDDARLFGAQIATELPRLIEHWLSGNVKVRKVVLPGLPGGKAL